MVQLSGERPRYRVRLVGLLDDPIVASVDGRNRWRTEPVWDPDVEQSLANLAEIAMLYTDSSGLSPDMLPAIAMVRRYPGSEVLDPPDGEAEVDEDDFQTVY